MLAPVLSGRHVEVHADSPNTAGYPAKADPNRIDHVMVTLVRRFPADRIVRDHRSGRQHLRRPVDPVIISAMPFIIGLLFVRESKDRPINARHYRQLSFTF